MIYYISFFFIVWILSSLVYKSLTNYWEQAGCPEDSSNFVFLNLCKLYFFLFLGNSIYFVGWWQGIIMSLVLYFIMGYIFWFPQGLINGISQQILKPVWYFLLFSWAIFSFINLFTLKYKWGWNIINHNEVLIISIFALSIYLFIGFKILLDTIHINISSKRLFSIEHMTAHAMSASHEKKKWMFLGVSSFIVYPLLLLIDSPNSIQNVLLLRFVVSLSAIFPIFLFIYSSFILNPIIFIVLAISLYSIQYIPENPLLNDNMIRFIISVIKEFFSTNPTGILLSKFFFIYLYFYAGLSLVISHFTETNPGEKLPYTRPDMPLGRKIAISLLLAFLWPLFVLIQLPLWIRGYKIRKSIIDENKQQTDYS